MNRFYFGGSDSSDSGDDTLPYPKPLAQSAFLAPDFGPTSFLASLENRHQTLEDLRTELRTRSQELSKELLDLVNENYQDFLSLGSSLRGGEDKVEEVRLALLGFRRDVDGLRGKVDSRRREVAALVDQRRKVRKEIQSGRRILMLDARLCELERNLMINNKNSNGIDPSRTDEMSDASDEDDYAEEEDSDENPMFKKLRRCVEQFVALRQGLQSLSEHILKDQMQQRLLQAREVILLDISNLAKQLRSTGDDGDGIVNMMVLKSSIVDST